MSTVQPSYARPFTLHSFTGTVAESGKAHETRVHGSGGGAHPVLGTQGPVHVSSTTVVHDQIFLVADDGKERAFQLHSFDVACRAGNSLTVHWAVPDGEDSGPYVAVINHTTEMTYTLDAAIGPLFVNPKAHLAMLVAATALIVIGFMVLPLLPVGLALAFWARKRAKTANKEIAAFRSQLA